MAHHSGDARWAVPTLRYYPAKIPLAFLAAACKNEGVTQVLPLRMTIDRSMNLTHTAYFWYWFSPPGRGVGGGV